MLCILLLAVSETVELLLHVIVASKDDKDDTLFSAVLAFINVDVDEVADAAPRRLANLPTVTVALHRYDVVMTHVLEDRDLVVHGPNALFIAVEELLFQDLDCCKSSIFYMPTEVDFGGVTLSEALDHLILSVKNRVCFSRLHCHAS